MAVLGDAYKKGVDRVSGCQPFECAWQFVPFAGGLSASGSTPGRPLSQQYKSLTSSRSQDRSRTLSTRYKIWTSGKSEDNDPTNNSSCQRYCLPITTKPPCLKLAPTNDNIYTKIRELFQQPQPDKSSLFVMKKEK